MFLNLLKTATERAKCGHFVEKDKIVRSLFSNLRITSKNSLIYLCNQSSMGYSGTQKFTLVRPTEIWFLTEPESSAVTRKVKSKLFTFSRDIELGAPA